ncbi:fungal-specific transcription factor domain-containing protein [Trametes meyenii]|nr:fungal-specific transcription factor domain-containing protein [Trametes meyenii]
MPPVKEKDSPEGEPRQRKRPGRVPVSCAECRRLKLRCDRKVPCETCTKRGCAALCPDGQLITGGKGTRQAVADVEDLKKKIAQLEGRSKTLEDALRTIQSAVSDEPHPLLQEGESTNGAATTGSSSESSPASHNHFSPPEVPTLTPDEEDILDAFGTLTLGLRGETRFFGQTSRSEYLIHAPEPLSSKTVPLPRLSQALVDEANKELDVPLRNFELGQQMCNLLPPLSQACKLCETFLEYGKFAWYPLPRKYIFDDILSVIYHVPQHSEECNIATLHSMSLLWMIYALATLFDPNSPPYAVEAQEYYLLARASLRFAPPAHDTTLTAIQSMIYMTQYLEMSDCEPAHTGSHKAWMQIGQAVKLGHSVYVSSSRWRLDEDATLKRNRVFWQLFVQDTWLSFGFGRPPSINLDFVDCEIPREPETVSSDQDQRELGFHIWTWQYAKAQNQIMTVAFGAKQPNYAKVMELDRKVRDFPVPSSLRVQCGEVENPPPTLALNIQRLLATLYKETTLLNLHRPYFSQALNGMPADPLRHKYGPSVMAIYRSAWRIFAAAKCAYKSVPHVSSRLGITWSYSLSGSIVMCLLITRAPLCNMAKCSLNELDKICELFEEAAGHSQIASNNIEVMRKLRKQAHEAYDKAQSGQDPVHIHSELDRLGGKTHLICSTKAREFMCAEKRQAAFRKDAPKPSTSTSTTATSSTTVAPTGPVPAPPPPPAAVAAVYEPPVQPDMIHPTIMQDMRAFDDGMPSGLFAETGAGEGGEGSNATAQFNLDFPSTAFPNPQQTEFPLFPDFDFASPAGTVGSAGTPSSASGSGSGSGTGVGRSGSTTGAGMRMDAMSMDPWAHPMSAALDPSAGVPVLDATWQAFVEQLGF